MNIAVATADICVVVDTIPAYVVRQLADADNAAIIGHAKTIYIWFLKAEESSWLESLM